jgi:uncharacterized protein YhfF
MDATTRRLRARTGLDIIGCYAFGSGPAQADELLAFVSRGTKRATAGADVELEALDDPPPAAGQLWGLLDGAGEPAFVAETVEVVPGRLEEVTPAFAWDEGEDDRTLESWWEGHRRWGEALGVDDPDRLEVVFERFRVVWPVPDRTVWLTDGVRELRFDERTWFRERYLARHGTADVTRGVTGEQERWPVAALPALVCERDGQRVGTLTFRPRPGGTVLIFTTDAFDGEDGVTEALRRGLAELRRLHGWEHLVDATHPEPRA